MRSHFSTAALPNSTSLSVTPCVHLLPMRFRLYVEYRVSVLNGIALRIINRHAALPRPRPSAPACHALGSGRVIQAKPPSANRQVGETTVSLRGDNMLPRVNPCRA